MKGQIEMKRRNFAIAILGISAFLLLQSCVQPKPIPIELEQAPSRIAVASQIIPGEAMIISLSKSFSALINTDTNQQNIYNNFLVDRGRVLLKVNGTTYKLNRIAPGFYGGILAPNAPGSTFELEVYDTTTGMSVNSSAQYMQVIPIDSSWFEKQVSAFDDTVVFLNLRFKDPVGENYYMINAYRNFSFAGAVTNLTNSLFNSNSSGVHEPISDAGFENKLNTSRIRLDGFRSGDTCTFTLTNIQKDYYTYLVERKRASRNVIGTVLGEPVTYTTNIKGGYGFFTAHVPSIKIKIIPK